MDGVTLTVSPTGCAVNPGPAEPESPGAVEVTVTVCVPIEVPCASVPATRNEACPASAGKATVAVACVAPLTAAGAPATCVQRYDRVPCPVEPLASSVTVVPAAAVVGPSTWTTGPPAPAAAATATLWA